MNQFVNRQSVALAAFVAVLTASAVRAEATYLGEAVPGEQPVLFAPGIVNTPAIELNGVVSPNGQEFFFTRRIDDVFIMHRRRLEEGRWSAPVEVLPYEGGHRATAVDMAYSPDSRLLYFLGRFNPDDPTAEGNLDIWVSETDGENYSAARVVPHPVSTDDAEFYPVVVGDGSLYFSSDRPGGLGAGDIYRAQRLADGSFAAPVNVGAPINSAASEGDTYVAPDESYLILTSRRPGGLGGGDLYISFREDSGGWSEPVSLGPTVNSPLTDFCPMVTPDGRFLFFSRRHGASWAETTEGEVFWMDASFLRQFRPAADR